MPQPSHVHPDLYHRDPARPVPPREEYADLDALLRGAKDSLGRADALQASVDAEAAGAVSRLPEIPRAPRSPWDAVKRVANWSPLGDENLGRESADLLDPNDLRDRKAAAGTYSTWDQIKSGLAGATGGLVDVGRNTATPVGAATTFAPGGRVGRAATGIASGIIAGEGLETLADPNADARDKAFGALNTILGAHGAARATHGLRLPEARTGAGAKGEFSPWESQWAQPKPAPAPEGPVPVSSYTGSGERLPLAVDPQTPAAPPVFERYAPNRSAATTGDIPTAPAPEPIPETPPAAAPARPRLSSDDVAAMLRGREKFDAANPGAELPPGTRDELDRMGVEYTRTQSELKRLLRMPDADPVETGRMSQGARELGSRLRKAAKVATPPAATPEPAAAPEGPSPLAQMLQASLEAQAGSVPPERAGHFKLPEAKVSDAVYEAARKRAGIEPSPLAAAEQPAGAGESTGSALVPERSDAFVGPEFPFAGDPERGAADIQLLANLMRIPAGAAIGSIFDPEDRTRGALIGGGLGAASLHPGTAKNLERLRYFSMLMGPAQVKNVLGNAGVATNTALERTLTHGPTAGGRVLKEFFSPETVAHAGRVFSGREVPIERMDQPTSVTDRGVMGLPFRAMGAVDEAAKGALSRAGIENPAERTFTADPKTDLGKATMQLQRAGGPAARFVLPFVKTAVNQAEAGLTPFAALRHLGSMTPAERKETLAKVAILAGYGAAGAAYGNTDFAEEHPALSPFAAVAAGGGALPFAVMQQYSRARNSGKNEAQALQTAGAELGHQMPMPSEWAFSPAAWIASLVPSGLRSLNPDQTERDTTGSVFGPALSRIPFLSKLLPAKGSGRKRHRRTSE